LIELGTAAGLATPTLRSLVTLAEFHLGDTVGQHHRSLASLGLDGRSIAEIRAVVAFDEIRRVRQAQRRRTVSLHTSGASALRVTHPTQEAIA
jgi:hypothetical protein